MEMISYLYNAEVFSYWGFRSIDSNVPPVCRQVWYYGYVDKAYVLSSLSVSQA